MKLTHKQSEALRIVKENPGKFGMSLCDEHGFSPNVLARLEDMGLIMGNSAWLFRGRAILQQRWKTTKRGDSVIADNG